MDRTLARIGFILVILAEIAGWILHPQIASDFTWFGLIVTALFSWAMVEIFRLPWHIWGLVILANIIDGLSALFMLYSKIEPWDRWIHGLGGFVIAAGALHLILRSLRHGHVSVKRHYPFVISSTYLIVAAIGFLYEFWEYLVDNIQYGYPKSLVNAYDSVEDQVSNLLGATVIIGIYFLYSRRGRSS
jgi:hypothetical protein